MKRQNWLITSLALNLMLLGIIAAFVRYTHSKNLPVGITVPPLPEVVSNPSTQPAERPTAARVTRTGWSQWIASMRDSGIPENVIAKTLAADFEDRWHQRERETRNQFARGEVTGDALNLLAAQHDGELEKQMLATLGPDSFRRWDKRRVLDELNLPSLNISASEEDTLYQELRKDYDRQTQKLQLANQEGDIDAANFDQQVLTAQSQYEQKLKQVLGNDSYAVLQNNNDSSAGNLRRSLLGMQVTDQQFSALAQAQQQWQDATTKLEQGGVKDSDQQMLTLAAGRDQQFQQVLGTGGFAEYQEKQDISYQTLTRYQSAWQLSDSDVETIYSTLHNYQSQAQAYQARVQSAKLEGQSLDWNSVQQNLQQFGSGTEQYLQAFLGKDRFDLMQRNNLFSMWGN